MLISNSTRTKSYAAQLAEKDKTKYKNYLTEDDWIQFLMDHREYMRARSTPYLLTEKDMMRYSYRIRDFLKDNVGDGQSSADCEQAFKVINRLGSNLDFNSSLRLVYIPKTTMITEIRKDYNTCQQQIKKLNITF